MQPVAVHRFKTFSSRKERDKANLNTSFSDHSLIQLLCKSTLKKHVSSMFFIFLVMFLVKTFFFCVSLLFFSFFPVFLPFSPTKTPKHRWFSKALGLGLRGPGRWPGRAVGLNSFAKGGKPTARLKNECFFLFF